MPLTIQIKCLPFAAKNNALGLAAPGQLDSMVKVLFCFMFNYQITYCERYLFLNEFYPAVLGAASLGLVVSHGFVRALADGTEVEAIDA